MRRCENSVLVNHAGAITSFLMRVLEVPIDRVGRGSEVGRCRSAVRERLNANRARNNRMGGNAIQRGNKTRSQREELLELCKCRLLPVDGPILEIFLYVKNNLDLDS
jgi:hypothetical protein